MSKEEVIVTYRIETPYDLNVMAEAMAGEQSTSTFTTIPGETRNLKELYGARVIQVKKIGEKKTASLPGVKLPQNHNNTFYVGEVTIAFPLHNFGPSIPNLLATVAGNLFEVQEFSGIRLLDIEIPDTFKKVYKGPKFGMEGTRKLTGVYERPVIGTIIKPSVGLNMEQLHELVLNLAMSGLDFIKDDELNANAPYAPLKDRVETVMSAVNQAAEKTGKKLMYAFNITDDIDKLKRNHDLVVKAGGNCVMVSINSIGIAGMSYLNNFSEVPIHANRNQWGMWTRSPELGMDFKVYQKLCRLAGADHLHVNGLFNKFFESNESVIQSINDCQTPMLGGYKTAPVVSNRQWPGTVHDTYNSTNTVDILHLAGGGIIAHPDGPKAGIKSMQLAWEAATKGVSLEEYAKEYDILQHAINYYSR